MLKSRYVNIAFVFFLLGVSLSDNYVEVPVAIYVLTVGLYIIAQAYGSIVLRAQFYVQVSSAGSPKSNMIALTFDDGPVPAKTEEIIKILKRFNVRASFFCIGHRVKEHPHILKALHESGHIIGNHSYWHGKMFDLQSSNAITKELEETNSVIHATIGLRPNYFRPPYGVTNPMVAAAITNTKLKTIGWSLRSMDTVTRDPDKLLRKVTRSIKSGDVVLFHDFCDSTIQILPAVIEYILSKGFTIVRLDELLNEKAYA